MKKLVMLVSLITLVFCAGLTQAQENDTMGLYFDLYGQNACLDADNLVPYTVLDLYLLLLNPSYPELLGFEVGMTVEGPAMLLSAYIANPQFIDIGSPGNHVVGFAEPMVLEEINHLVTFEMMYTSTSAESVCFILHGSDPSSIDPLYPTALYTGEVLLSLGIEYVYEDCSALIDPVFCDITPTDSATWDSLKSMYR